MVGASRVSSVARQQLVPSDSSVNTLCSGRFRYPFGDLYFGCGELFLAKLGSPMGIVSGRLAFAVVISVLFVGHARLRAAELLPVTDLLVIAETAQLPADAQAKFSKLYDEYGQSLQAYRDAVAKSGEGEPMWRVANERHQTILAEAAAAKQKLDVKQAAIAKQHPTLAANFAKWCDTYRSLYNETGMIKSLANDKVMRPYFIWSNHFVLTSRPRDQHPEPIRQFLPEDTKRMTAEEALKCMLKMAEGREEDKRPEQLKSLEKQLAEVELPRKEIEGFSILNALALLYQGYSTVRKPEAVKSAEQKVIATAEQVSTVWPGWQDAYREASAAGDGK
jgi:hypothetical protein